MLVKLIVQGTMQATARIANDKNLELDTDKVGDAMKAVLHDGYSELIRDLKEAEEARMGEAIYKQILNAGCIQFAIDTLRKAGYSWQ